MLNYVNHSEFYLIVSMHSAYIWYFITSQRERSCRIQIDFIDFFFEYMFCTRLFVKSKFFDYFHCGKQKECLLTLFNKEQKISKKFSNNFFKNHLAILNFLTFAIFFKTYTFHCPGYLWLSFCLEFNAEKNIAIFFMHKKWRNLLTTRDSTE